MTVKEHVKNYGHNTSLKGVSKIIKSQNVSLKVLWAIAFVTGLGTGLYLLVTLLIKYFSYTTVSKVTSCTGCHPPFPDVTLCNVYPLGMNNDYEQDHPGKMKTLLEYRSILEEMSDQSNLTVLRQELSLSDDQLFDMFGLIYSLSGYIENINVLPIIEWMVNKPKYEGFVNRCKWYDWENLPYGKENCMRYSRYYIKNTDYGLCTTIHMNDTREDSSNEQVRGFEALLYLNRYNEIFMPDYTQHLLRTQASGVRVLIHPPNTYPLMSQGFNIPPGHEVEIRIKAEEIILEPEPYSNCTKTDDLFEGDLNDISESHSVLIDYTYSDSVSRALCKQEFYIKKCGCFHHALPVPNQLKLKYPNLSSCVRIDNIEHVSSYADINLIKFLTKLKCATYDIDESINLDDLCYRQERCSQFKYPYQVQQSPWPDVVYMVQFYCKFISTNYCSNLTSPDVSPEFLDRFDYLKDIVKMQDSDEEQALAQLKSEHQEENLIAKNFIQLKVLFSDPEIMSYKAVPSVTAEFLFGSLGGILNLWIGVTFFTFVEWADLCLIIVREYFKKNNDINTTDNKQKEEKNKSEINDSEKEERGNLKLSPYHS